jgi:hypothetical protein
LIIFAYPLYPLLEQLYYKSSMYLLFKRGEEEKRGEAPHPLERAKHG